jgi:hypothetical protein
MRLARRIDELERRLGLQKAVPGIPFADVSDAELLALLGLTLDEFRALGPDGLDRHIAENADAISERLRARDDRL